MIILNKELEYKIEFSVSSYHLFIGFVELRPFKKNIEWLSWDINGFYNSNL